MIYLIRSSKYLKIGFTTNLEHRMKQYETHNPDFQLLNYKKDSKKDETRLHQILNKYRVNNTEWFIYNKKVIDIFKSLLRQEYTYDKISKKEVLKDYSRLKKLIQSNKLMWDKSGKFLIWNN